MWRIPTRAGGEQSRTGLYPTHPARPHSLEGYEIQANFKILISLLLFEQGYFLGEIFLRNLRNMEKNKNGKEFTVLWLGSIKFRCSKAKVIMRSLAAKQ